MREHLEAINHREAILYLFYFICAICFFAFVFVFLNVSIKWEAKAIPTRIRFGLFLLNVGFRFALPNLHTSRRRFQPIVLNDYACFPRFPTRSLLIANLRTFLPNRKILSDKLSLHL